jgi:Ni/Co efflux regulator RcnB
MQKFIAAFLAVLVTATAFAPAPAFADHRRDGYYDRGDHDRYDHRRRRHHDDDDDEAIAAGVIGLVLGLAVGAAVSDSNRRRYDEGRCYDNYQRCAPPEGYYRDDYYDDRGYYGDDRCVRTERVWDRRAQRYVTIEVPC